MSGECRIDEGGRCRCDACGPLSGEAFRDKKAEAFGRFLERKMGGGVTVDLASHSTAEDANRFAAEVQEQLRARGLPSPAPGSDDGFEYFVDTSDLDQPPNAD